MQNMNKEQLLHTAKAGIEVKRRSDKLMNYFLLGFFLAGFVFAGFYGTWLIALGIGGLSLLAYYSVKIALPTSDLYRNSRHFHGTVHLPDAWFVRNAFLCFYRERSAHYIPELEVADPDNGCGGGSPCDL